MNSCSNKKNHKYIILIQSRCRVFCHLLQHATNQEKTCCIQQKLISRNICSQLDESESTDPQLKIHPFIHSIGMCRMQQFPSLLRSFIHSSLSYTFSFHPSPTTSLPSSLTSSCHLFLCLPLGLIVSKFIYYTFLGILFSSILYTGQNQHNLFNLIVSVIVGFLPLHKFLYWLISSNFLFHCHILGLKFFYILSFQKCLFTFYLSLLVTRFLMHMLKFCLIIVFFSPNFSFLDIFSFLKKLL